MLKRVMSRLSVEIFFVSQYRKTSQGNPSVLCFRKFPLAKKFMDKGVGVKEVSKLSVEYFLSHSAEKFLNEPFSVSLVSGIEKC